MTDREYSLTRRNVLGAACAIGGAAAIGGAGSMAFFSDEETYANNRLVAGELDLKLAWQELYYGAAAENAFESGAVSTSNLFGSDVLRTESYPQPGAGVSFENLATTQACSQAELYADVPDDMDPTSPGSNRPLNADTYDTESEAPRPLINIQDAKPGDFGFTRFRLLLCDNPGYIWTGGGIRSQQENGINEPESKDPDQPSGAQATGGELADEIRIRVVQATSGAAFDSLFGTVAASTGPELSQAVFDLFDMQNAATLREFSDAVSQGPGFPLDADPFDGSTAGDVHSQSSDVFTYDIANGGSQQQERDCFDPEGGAGQLGIVWALAADHANEIQSDSLSVDLQFYTEQCRHNDGSGQTN